MKTIFALALLIASSALAQVGGYQSSGITASGSYTAQTITLAAPSGQDALVVTTQGARVRIGPAANSYFYEATASTMRTPNSLQAGEFISGIFRNGSNGPLLFQAFEPDGATAKAFQFQTSYALANATSKIATFQNLTTEKLAIDKAGKFVRPTGTADAVVGRSVLVAGSVTVNTTSVTATSVILLTNCATGGTAGLLRVGTVTAGTSFVIQSASGSDTSTICWHLMN